MFLLFNLPIEVVLIILAACYSGDLHSLSLVNRSVSHLTDERRRKLHVMCLPPFNIRAPHRKFQIYIWLPRKNIGYEDIVALCRVLDCGSFRSLRHLKLEYNQIGDLGMVELSNTVANGSILALKTLNLSDNLIGDTGLQAFAGAIGSGSLRSLEVLDLRNNQIGDAGMVEFSRQIPIGSLRALTYLDLEHNQIGDRGIIEFSRSIAMDPLPACKMIAVFGNPGNAAPLKAACEERGYYLFN